jgi:hypothetical protein
VIDLARLAGSAAQTPGSSSLLDSSLTANGQQPGTRAYYCELIPNFWCLRAKALFANASDLLAEPPSVRLWTGVDSRGAQRGIKQTADRPLPSSDQSPYCSLAISGQQRDTSSRRALYFSSWMARTTEIMQNTDEPTVSHLDSDLLVALVTPGIFKDAVISIMATIAKQENIRRSERIVAGLQRAKRNGSRLGRPHVSSAKASRTTLWRRRSQ